MAKQNTKKLEMMRKTAKVKNSKERFIRTRMWISILLSRMFADRVSIPKDIGNNILIENNAITTKNSITEYAEITCLSFETPVSFISDMIKYVKERVSNVRLDVQIRIDPYYVDPFDNGLLSRVAQWKRTIDNYNEGEAYAKRTFGRVISKKTADNAAVLINTYETIKRGETCYMARIILKLRAQTGAKMGEAKKTVEEYLRGKNIEYRFIKDNIEDYFNYSSLLSYKVNDTIISGKYNIISSTSLSEILPTMHDINSTTGVLLGEDLKNGDHYFLDVQGSSAAKNIYVLAPSGIGKTFIVINWIAYAYVTGCNVCIWDIKGTEFNAFTKACGGVTLSLRQESTEFINVFKLDKNTEERDSKLYFNERMDLCKQMLVTMCNMDNNDQVPVVIERFLKLFYMSRGVIAENRNSWVATERIHPFDVYDEFEKFLSVAVKEQYPFVTTMYENLGIYLSRTGSMSHMFTKEFTMEDILNARVLTFDFGMLGSTANQNEVVFKIKTMFAADVDNAFIAEKKRRKEWTWKVLEESQLATQWLLSRYTVDITLRRAMNQITVLLGNALGTLEKSPAASAILENLNMLCIGPVKQSARKSIVEKFDLESYEEDLKMLVDRPQDFENAFLFVNRFRKSEISSIIRANVPESARTSKLFKFVDEVEDDK